MQDQLSSPMKTSEHEINGNNAPDHRNGPDMTQKVQLGFTDERGVATHLWCPSMSETKSSFQPGILAVLPSYSIPYMSRYQQFSLVL